MERFGLVGLPNAGKSSLFNALTGGGALAAPYPFSTTEPNVGVATVPDDRLDAPGRDVEQSSKVVHADRAVRRHRRPGRRAPARARGSATGSSAGIREVDAIVLRAAGLRRRRRARADRSARRTSARGAGAGAAPTPPAVEGQLERRRKAARADKSAWPTEVAALEQALATVLADGDAAVPRRAATPTHASCLRPYFLLTEQAGAGRGQPRRGRARRRADASCARSAEPSSAATVEVLGVCVQLEAEAAQLDGAERAEMLDGLGLGEGALPRLVRSAYHLLGLRTFLTTGDKESRAWTFRAGAKAPECAGVIHSDLQRGFIRAEVIRWDELLDIGSWNKAKELGQAAGRGQGLRGRRRRRAGDPLQRLSARRARSPSVPAAPSGTRVDRAGDQEYVCRRWAERPGAIATGPGSLGRVDSTGVSSSSLSRKAGGVRCP